jgi:hypothetical protein
MYRLRSPQEIETILNNWLNGGAEDPGAPTDVGTTRNAATSDALDDLVAEVKGAPPAKDSSPAAAKKPKKSDDGVKKQSLDDAFADLMGDS